MNFVWYSAKYLKALQMEIPFCHNNFLKDSFGEHRKLTLMFSIPSIFKTSKLIIK